jgi:RNA-dependent RNA polymerase
LTHVSGDYDGDTAVAIWQKTIVDNFQNAPDNLSVEPEDVDACFSRGNENAAGFLERTSRQPSNAQIHAYQSFLLGALRETSLVGQYSNFHDNAIYKLGYSHPETIRLAFKLVHDVSYTVKSNCISQQIL